MEKDLIKAFQFNDEVVLKKLYSSYKQAFLIFAKKYKLEVTELDDIFQDSFIVLRNQALSGKLVDVKSSMKTYLFGISKNLIFNMLKRKKRFTIHYEEKNIPLVEITENAELQEHELTFDQKILRHFFTQLGEKCQDVLTLSFYRGLTNEEIAIHRNYENEAVVRSHKSRCLKNLKELLKQGNKN